MADSRQPIAVPAWLTCNSLARRVAQAGFLAIARRRMRRLTAVKVQATQERILLDLVRHAQTTQFGLAHDFIRIRSVRDFQRLVPLRTYDDFWRDWWQPVYPRLRGVTWPAEIPYYALSSGTTSGTTKYIPVSKEMLASNRRAGTTVLSAFLCAEPRARLLAGQMFFLGGSTDLAKQADGSLAGDLSGIVNREVPGWFRSYSYPPLELALINDWDLKVERLAEDSARRNITLIGGVPSWLLILFAKLRQVTGKDRLADIWPGLRLLIHGGVKFDPYRDTLRREVGSERVRFVETYPCSEGFVAFEDPHYDLLRLIPDHGIFFEFVPVEELEKPNPARHTAAEVELGVQYAVVLTTCAGLWAYVVGDTVAFERRNPPLLRFTGRTRYSLSAFGEHLISDEVEKAIAASAATTGAAVRDFHVGPVFPQKPGELGRHQYLVEFHQLPSDLSEFAWTLDAELCRLNDDYRAHRAGGVGMAAPEVAPLAAGAFAAWMRAHGKLGGQHKVPRMDNTGQLTFQMLAWMTQHGHCQRVPATGIPRSEPVLLCAPPPSR